ncbi:hypothetical protein SOASR030_06370 [Leminorella grimontii]|uniref:Type VI secretion protein n=1 Tax=Leminorella grimontii TaxID=82981 RepID=A0AAV5MXF3_9GAMM|nr:hypothetical protein [Leminorella grimontii]KFC96284.1 hypothetical protein GLGR_1460 [Leminorella grimontii ATCC 33999 = DSM 5078]GKX54525.1 hypothetical protein SOASR030_06370 [Leminorella grimontii]GKX57942.1 hypothetical protein SOASR031_02570 [Leminorella grimontii]VFS59004.1 Uncharacterised protein [Leminorella grimontii]
MRLVKRTATISLFVALMTGCSLLPGVRMNNLEYSVTPKANEGEPILVDFVAVEGGRLTAQLEHYTSEQWFKEKSDLLKKNAKGLIVWPIVVRPGTSVTLRNVPLYGKPADNVFLFANYKSKGAHRLELERSRLIKLEFRDGDVYAVN